MRGLWDAICHGLEIKSDQAMTSLPDFMSWGETKSGQTVNYQTALRVTTVLACCTVLCEDIANLTWKVMKQRPDGKGADPATDHPLYPLLNRRPNDYQTAFEFRETMVLHLALAKNAYVYISRGAGDRILELIPIEPTRVAVTRNADLSLTYSVAGDDGGPAMKLTSREIWHTRGLSWNGWMGMETVRLAAEAIGLSMALESSHARQHANGVQPGGTYSVQGVLTAEQHDQLTAWIKKHAAAANRGGPLILDNGATWLQQQMTGVDSQHVETRRVQVEEICRAFRIMPIMVGAADKTASYASAEQMFIAHDENTLQPMCERLEQSADVRLLGVSDDTGFYTHLNLRGRQRGTLKDQSEYFAKALGSGGSPAWLTQDEVRDELDLLPMGGNAAELREPSNVGKPSPSDKPSEAS